VDVSPIPFPTYDPRNCTANKGTNLKKIAIAAAITITALTACAQTGVAPASAVPAEIKELVIRDTLAGDGRLAEKDKAVLVHYTGWVYDPKAPDQKGAQFDTSAGRTAPFGFIIGRGRVIKGWDEGVPGMKEGGKRTLIIPPAKGYGATGAGEKIPPNATLLFEVELVKVLN